MAEAGGLPLDPTAEYPFTGGLNNTGLANGSSHEVRLEQTPVQGKPLVDLSSDPLQFSQVTRPVPSGQKRTQFKMARKHASRSATNTPLKMLEMQKTDGKPIELLGATTYE